MFRPTTAPAENPSMPQAVSPLTPERLESRVLLSGAQDVSGRTAVGDLNGDGRADLVIGTTGRGKSANSTPVVLLATGVNTYAAPAVVQVPAGAGSAVVLADINADGKLDLITSGSRRGARGTANPNSPQLLLGTGTGTFGTAASLNVPKSAGATYMFAVGDFSADGKPDIVVEGGKIPRADVTADNRGGRQLLLLQNNGTGTFAGPVSVPVATKQIVALAAGGFGSLTGNDLVVAGRGSGKAQTLTLVRNLTGSTGATSIPVATEFGKISDVVVGDFNKDAKLDVVVASSGGTGAARKGGLTLLRGNGDGTFASGTPIASAPVGTGTVEVGDFNQDTNLDLLTGSARAKGRGGFTSTLNALLNTGTGAFQAAAPITVA